MVKAVNPPRPVADLTTGVAAVKVGVLPYKLRELAERGVIPGRKVGRNWAFAVADLDAIRKAAAAAGCLVAGT